MLPAHTFAQTQIATLGAQPKRIAFAVRIGCVRALRMLHAIHAPRDTTWQQLEEAACLPPLDQVPAVRLRQDLERNADAILGSGSSKVVAALAALLPRGSDRPNVPAIAFQAVAARITPDVLSAATHLFESESLLSQAFLQTVGLKDWAGFWNKEIPTLARHHLHGPFWMSTEIRNLAPGADADLHVAQVRAIASHARKCAKQRYTDSAIPRMPKPETIGPLLWLECASFAHLVDVDGSTAYPVIARKKAMDVNAAAANTDSWLAARAIWRQADGEAPWGLNAADYLRTPPDERKAALLALIEPVWEAPKAAAPLTKKSLARRNTILKTFVADTSLPLTMPVLMAIAERYTMAVDAAIATHDDVVRTEALEEAQAMRTLLERPVGKTPRGPYDPQRIDDRYHGTLMTTGAMVFMQTGKACADASYPSEEWDFACSRFGRNEKIDIEGLVRRAEVAFMVKVLPSLNRLNTWKAMVFAQHKPKMAGPLLDALDQPENTYVCQGMDKPDMTTHLGAAMDYGKGRGSFQIGYSRALWDIADPDLRVDIFHRLEKGNGFHGVPGRNLPDYGLTDSGPDLLLLHTMLYAHRQGLGFEQAGRRVKIPCLVQDLIKAGQGTAFFERFTTLDAFVATPWETIEAIADELMDRKRIA